jgi:ribose-phosphate pyrophosphokinase
MKIFALHASRAYGEKIARALGMPLAAHEEREFEDGEHKVRPREGVRGQDVYVIQSLYADPEQSVNDKLCRLLFFLRTLKDCGAARITAVMPYLAYARKDRRSKARDPLTTRYVAELLEAAGADRVVTMDVHNVAAYENAFRCMAEHVEAKQLFAGHFLSRCPGELLCVVSPDVGGVKRAAALSDALQARLQKEVPVLFMEKYRSGGVVSGETLVGRVSGMTAIILDDLIATGGTIERAAAACIRGGARHVHGAATHGLFVPPAAEVLAGSPLESIVVTDTVPAFRLAGSATAQKLAVIESAPLLAEAIRRLHTGGSISELLGRD